ncbi:MAG: hypothetical protein K1W24_06780 [Lachnospiraceae bacterium]
MDKESFYKIFNNELVPFIEQIGDNNSLIKTNDLSKCKKEIFNQYNELKQQYKDVIFGKGSERLLDRHKVASSICGAFLRIPVFNKTELIETLKRTREPVEAYFYYVNELIAFYAGYKYLSFYMMYGRDYKEKKIIIEDFPVIPPTIRNSTHGGLSSILFNLSQIKDKRQIGIEKYDRYSYAMFFFMLENYFYLDKNMPVQVSNAKQ